MHTSPPATASYPSLPNPTTPYLPPTQQPSTPATAPTPSTEPPPSNTTSSPNEATASTSAAEHEENRVSRTGPPQRDHADSPGRQTWSCRSRTRRTRSHRRRRFHH